MIWNRHCEVQRRHRGRRAVWGPHIGARCCSADRSIIAPTVSNFHGGHRLHVWDRWKASCHHDTGLHDEYVRGPARIALTCSAVAFPGRENVGKATLINCNDDRDTFP